MHETLLILHFIGLALGLGANFAVFTLGFAAAKLPPDERRPFMLRALVLSKNGSYGLLLLILSGLGILFYRGAGNVMRWGGGAFHAKLTLVLVLCGIVGYSHSLMKKVREGGGPEVLAKLRTVGRIGMATSVAIVVLAVIAFK